MILRNYEVYFELYGRRMKTTVLAENEGDATSQILQKVKFHKVAKAKDEFNEAADIMDGFMNIINNIAK